jgi:integrase
MTDHLIPPYRRWLQEHDLSDNTIGQRASFLARIAGEIDPQTATAGDLSLWLQQFDGWSRRSYLGALRSVMTFMVDTGRRADNPANLLRANPTPDVQPNPLEPEDEARYLLVVRGADHALALLGLRAGLRAHEAAKFAGEDITKDRIRILGKGGKLDYVPTHPQLWELAQHYPRKGFWFPSYGRTGHITSKWVSARASAVLEAIGTDGSFHRLRATYGTTLLRSGVNIKVVQRLMRHSSLSSTEHYLGVAESELESAIGMLGAASMQEAA